MKLNLSPILTKSIQLGTWDSETGGVVVRILCSGERSAIILEGTDTKN
jgi:hypothetical protein